MNDVDRCDRCGGAGNKVEYRIQGKLADGRDWCDYKDGPCFQCRGLGTLDPVASLARAMQHGNTLAWCMVHAADGDPLPAHWDLGRHAGELIAVMRGHPWNSMAASWYTRETPPTLEQVLAWEKSRRR